MYPSPCLRRSARGFLACAGIAVLAAASVASAEGPVQKAGPQPTANAIECAGFAHTRVIDLSWSSPQRMYTRDVGGFGLNDVLVIRFTTGTMATAENLPRISAAEYRSAPHWRIAALSEKPCDFGPQPTPGATITGTSVTAVFALGDGSGFDYYPILETNRTYYLNIRNSPDSNCAASGVCDMFVDLIKAGRL